MARPEPKSQNQFFTIAWVQFQGHRREVCVLICNGRVISFLNLFSREGEGVGFIFTVNCCKLAAMFNSIQ
jgi:hypothetical protein